MTLYIKSKLPDKVNAIIDYLTSPGTVVPIIILLLLIIFYLFSTVGSLKEANSDLKSQLRREKDDDELEQENKAEIVEPPSTPGMEKKHVRINAEFINTDDKAQLLKS